MTLQQDRRVVHLIDRTQHKSWFQNYTTRTKLAHLWRSFLNINKEHFFQPLSISDIKINLSSFTLPRFK